MSYPHEAIPSPQAGLVSLTVWETTHLCSAHRGGWPSERAGTWVACRSYPLARPILGPKEGLPGHTQMAPESTQDPQRL